MQWIVEILVAILFGIVEGITEWLPISSTGHMILLEEPLGVTEMFTKTGADGKLIEGYGEGFWSMFLVVIQLGAILAVIIYFWNKLWPFGKKKAKEDKIKIWKTWLKTLIAVVPAAVVGLLLDDLLDKYLYNALTVAITLILYGILFILMENWNKRRTFKVLSVEEMNYKTAFFIGLFQVLALIPGTSRSGITILGAMFLLCNRETAAEFSFFLSIPVMVGASLLKVVKFLLNYGMFGAHEAIFLLVGCAVAFIVSFFCVKWLMAFVKKHDFQSFGLYRIVLGVIVLIFFIVTLE